MHPFLTGTNYSIVALPLPAAIYSSRHPSYYHNTSGNEANNWTETNAKKVHLDGQLT